MNNASMIPVKRLAKPKSVNHNASTIPVKVKIVRECARIEREFEPQRLKDDLILLSHKIESRVIDENNSWFRRTFGKQVPVPSPSKLVEQWYLDFNNGKMITDTAPGWEFNRVRTGWWQRLKQFVALPAETDDDVMMLSIEDAKLIELNANYAKVTQ